MCVCVCVCVCNTMFRKKPEKTITHERNSSKRQIDFILISKKLRPRLRDSEACDAITVGEDHRIVKAVMQLKKLKKKRYYGTTKKAAKVNRKANDKDKFAAELDKAVLKMKEDNS